MVLRRANPTSCSGWGVKLAQPLTSNPRTSVTKTPAGLVRIASSSYRDVCSVSSAPGEQDRDQPIFIERIFGEKLDAARHLGRAAHVDGEGKAWSNVILSGNREEKVIPARAHMSELRVAYCGVLC